MFDRVLTVCVGNICRSPMAEGLLRARLAARGPGAVVESAGIAALVGRPADPTAVALMAERGIDISGHLARQLTPELAAGFDLVLVMEQWHRREVEVIAPAMRGRVHRFGNFDVPDPYRQPRAVFADALELIERGIAELEKAWWPPR